MYLSKLWKEWVIDWYLKYKMDVFFSIRIRIVLFYVSSVIVIVLVTVGLTQYVQHIMLAGVIESLKDLLTDKESLERVFDSVHAEINLAQMIAYAVIFGITILIGFIATRLSLKPMRDSLIVQRRFIASVAHELRTPLSILKTQNEVAKLEMDPANPEVELLEQNVLEIDRITEILNNLLLFSRINTIESIVFEAVNLESIVTTVISRVKKLAEKRGVSILFEPSPIPYVYGNATGLEQAFFNIIKNGVIYSSRNGSVTITCTQVTESYVTLSISDTGIGIGKYELPHIFEPFYRTDRVAEISKGTGLGLALVFEIIKLHNGRIAVQSTVDVGTRFDISLPRQPQKMNGNRQQRDSGITFDFSR